MQSSPDSQPRNSGSFTTKQGGTFISTEATAAFNNKSGGIKSSYSYTSVPSENTHGSNQLLISPQNDSALPMFGANT